MTAVVAWLALVVSFASLVWQMLTWKRSGPLLHVQIFPAWNQATRGDRGYIVLVTNIGRQAAIVHDVTLFTGRKDYGTGSRPKKYYSKLPARVEPGEELIAAWYSRDGASGNPTAYVRAGIRTYVSTSYAIAALHDVDPERFGREN